MKYSPDDIHRSLRRHVAAALTDWDVWAVREEVKDSARPIAIVETSSPITTTRARVTIPQGDVDKMQAFSVQAYPVIADTARESRLVAQGAQALLDDAIVIGLVTDAVPAVNIGGPFRIPVYDYSAVAVKGSAASRRGPTDPYGYLWVEDHSVNMIQDPIDHLRFTVVLDLRVSWTAPGREPPTAPIAATMDGTYEAVGP